MDKHALALLLALFGQAPRAPAQDLRWRLPPLGAAEYGRRGHAHSAVADSAAAARDLTPDGAVPERFLPRLLPAPWLCQGELDADQRAVAEGPRDLRGVVRAVAFDLGARGSGRWLFARVPPFGDLVVSGRVGPLAANGEQELQLAVARRPPAPLPGEPRAERERWVAPLCACDAEGTLTVRRTIDGAAGVVREFAADLALVVEEEKRRYRKIALQERWQIVAVRQDQDADFRHRVAVAVRAGAAWLRDAFASGPSYLQDGEPGRSFGSGRTALLALALLHAGVPREDPVVQGAFAALRRHKLVDTYSLGTALMAMAQRYAPPREAELVRTGQLAARARRQLDDQDRRVAEKWLRRLLDNIDTRGEPAGRARFCYVERARWDNSLAQYGLLGLDAAELCGLEVPATLWQAAASQLLAVQGPAGRSVELVRTTYRELADAAGGPPVRPRPVRTPARGFAYRGPDEPAYGSLTAAGTAALVLARAGLLRGDARRAVRELDDGIASAFAWLADRFTVRANPGFVGKSDRYWYYWLYCLERACALTGTARLQGRDWYYEGGLQLLAQQQPDGSFRAGDGSMAVEATCFALLFLSKSTLPAVTTR